MNSGWMLEFSPKALRELKKLDRKAAESVFRELERIAATGSPRSKGKALTGRFKGLWRYRIGDYRVICDLDDGKMVIFAVRVGHRSDIYR